MSGLISTQRRVGRDEGLVERHHQLDGLADLVAGQAERERQLARLKRLQAERRVDERLEDPVRRLFGDLLDLDAAVRAHHQHGPLRRPVDDEAEIQLAR